MQNLQLQKAVCDERTRLQVSAPLPDEAAFTKTPLRGALLEGKAAVWLADPVRNSELKLQARRAHEGLTLNQRGVRSTHDCLPRR